jgi:hypothetical protein
MFCSFVHVGFDSVAVVTAVFHPALEPLHALYGSSSASSRLVQT